jgi:hypothetical protein
MSTIIPLLLLSLLASPAVDPGELHRDEVRLLHLAVRPGDLAAHLRIFDPRSGDWLATETNDPPSAKLVVLYLFSPTAPATQSELGWLRKLATRVEAAHHGDVRFLFIAESATAAEMKTLTGSLSERPPVSPFFLDPQSAIGESLRQLLPGSRLPLPATLLLDERRAVRQVLIGALDARRGELVSGISDLLFQIREASALPPPPPQLPLPGHKESRP